MASVVLLLILVLISFAIGRRLLSLCKIRFHSLLENVVFSTGIGLGIISYLVLALAFTGLLYKWSCLILLSVLFCFTLFEIWLFRKSLPVIWRKMRLSLSQIHLSSFESALLIVLAVFVVLCLFSTFAPPTDHDALFCHLAIPKIWIQNHRAVHIYYNPYSEYHLFIQTLYVLGLLLADDTFATLFIWMVSILLILSVFSFCRRYFSARIGIIASVAIYCTPLFSALATKPMVDIPLIYYIFLGLYGFFDYIDSNNYKMLLLTAVVSGLAAATKYSGQIFFIILFGAVTIVELKRRKFNLVALKRIIAFGFVFFLILTPWYIKSYVNTGNLMNTQNCSSIVRYFINIFVARNSTSSGNTYNSVKSVKFGQAIMVVANFFKFLVIEAPFYDSRTIFSSTGVFILAFVPCLILLNKVNKVIKYLLILSFLGLPIFYLFVKNTRTPPRILLPMFIGLYISGAYVSYYLLDTYKGILRISIQVFIIITFLFNIIPLAELTYETFPVVIGFETKSHYINRMTNTYDVMKYANENLGNDVKILTMDRRAYYFDKPYIIHYAILDVVDDMPQLLERLRSEGITHLFYNSRFKNTGYSPLPEELRSYITPLYSEDSGYLFKFNDQLSRDPE